MKYNTRKFRYLGYTYLCVPEPWQPIVYELLVNIDKVVKPKYVPRFLLNLLHFFAYGWTAKKGPKWLPNFIRYCIGWFRPYGQVVGIRHRGAYKLHSKLINCVITDIKTKYASLRIYGYFPWYVQSMVEGASDLCDQTCEVCGSTEDVKPTEEGWVYALCKKCRKDPYFLNKII